MPGKWSSRLSGEEDPPHLESSGNVVPLDNTPGKWSSAISGSAQTKTSPTLSNDLPAQSTAKTPGGIPPLSDEERASMQGNLSDKRASQMMTGMTDIPIGRRLSMMKSTLLAGSDEEIAKEYLRLGGQKIRRDKDGTILIQFDNGQWGKLNPKGIDTYDIGRLGAMVMQFLPASGAASKASAGRGLAARIAAQGAGAGTTALVSEKIQPEFDQEQVPIEAALAAAPEAIIAGAKPVAKATASAAKKLISGGKTAAVAFTALKKTEEEVANNILKWANKAEQQGGINFLSKRARSTADEYIKAVKAYADKQAEPFFKEAESIAGDTRFDVSDIIAGIDQELKRQPKGGVGPIADRLKQAKKFLSGGSEKKILFNEKTGILEEKTVELQPTFAQLKSAKEILDDIAFEKIGEKGLGPNTARRVKSVSKAIRDKLIKATEKEAGDPTSSPYKKGLEWSSAGHSAKKRLQEDLIGNIAFAKEANVDDLASTVFRKSPTTAKRALVVLDSQRAGTSDTLRMMEMHARLQRASERNMQEFLKVMFPKKKGGDALVQTMGGRQRRILSKMESLMKEYVEKRGKTDLRILEGTNVSPHGGTGIGVSRLIVNPVNWVRWFTGRVSGASKIRQLQALSEVMTNPEVAKTKEMRKFMNLDFRVEDDFIEGMRIISLLTDEIAAGIPGETTQEDNQ